MADQKPLGLFELNRQIRQVVQAGFPQAIWVIAEISDFSHNRNGHVYLELIEKESEGDRVIARSKATIWSSSYRMLRPFFESTTGQELMPGIKILVKVDVEFHELYSISLNIRDIDPSFTIGDLARKRQMIIRRLKETGVFEMNKELSIPLVPQKIAIISSPTAAGYGDFHDQLHKNGNGYRFYTQLFPAIMQGEETGNSIISALDRIAAYDHFFDVVVIIRGGGSKLDLSSFDHYELGLNVAQFPLPVITGIGHEQDDSIIDLVANTRCKTPTAVAEFLISRVENFEIRLDHAVQSTIDIVHKHLISEKNFLSHVMEGMRLRVKGFTEYKRLGLKQIVMRSRSASAQYFRSKRDTLARYEQVATLKHPVNILKMGYSITMKDGKPLKSVKQATGGDEITTLLSDGRITSVINNK